MAWWNVQNLFDEENAPVSRHPEKVARAIGADMRRSVSSHRDALRLLAAGLDRPGPQHRD